MNLSVPTLQAGAIAWAALAVADEALSGPLPLTIALMVLAILNQFVAFGATHTAR